MKKALIIISCCLLIAIVALCVVWGRLNGQKADLNDKLSISDRTLQATVAEADGYKNSLTVAENRVTELESALAAAEQKAADAEKALADKQSEMETQRLDAENQLKVSAESVENAVTRANAAEENAQTLTEQLSAAAQSLQDVENRASDAEQNAESLKAQLAEAVAAAEKAAAESMELSNMNDALTTALNAAEEELEDLRSELVVLQTAKDEAETRAALYQSLSKRRYSAVAKNAIMTLAAGPARAVSAMPSFGFLKYLELTGTGFA